ncbi:MAG: Transcription elongation factor GreA [Parcubacteria group bacterium GW2011_GWA2_38_13]|nr:MAG: Transcription elongation factor GreA [Parcubacteria group bacterium GW2011_GWA2_38_13]
MPYYITKDGLEKLKKELEALKTVSRKDVIERIRNAKELGDLSENAEYSDAKEEQGFIEGKIIEKENFIRKAVIIDSNNKDVVMLGSTIVVECENENIKREYTIVGSNEANPSEGRVSNESPLGKAFLGKKLGNIVEVVAPKTVLRCKIIEIK